MVISLALAGSFVLAAPLNAVSERSYQRFKVPLSRLEARSLLAADQPIALGEVDAVVLGMGASARAPTSGWSVTTNRVLATAGPIGPTGWAASSG